MKQFRLYAPRKHGLQLQCTLMLYIRTQPTKVGSMSFTKSVNPDKVHAWILSESMLLVKDIKPTFPAFAAVALCFKL